MNKIKTNSEFTPTLGKVEKVKRHISMIIEEASPGDQIPPELKLANSLEVSHSTVRRALDALVNEEILCRKQGSGTFVNYKKNKPEKTENELPLDDFFKMRSYLKTPEVQHELKFFTYEAPREIAIYQRLLQEFEHDNPKFRFKLETCPSSVNFPSYFYDIEANRAPELFYLNQSHLFWLIKNRFIQPIDELIDDPHAFDNLDQFVKRAITYQNKIWVMPKNLNVFYLLYNKKIFDARGIPYPNANWTWEDYLKMALELTGAGNGNEHWFGTVPHRDYLYLSILVWAFGGELVDSSGKIQLESDASMEALKFAVDLTMKHKVTIPPQDWTYWNGTPASRMRDDRKTALPFINGKLGMCIKPGTDLTDYILKPDLDFGIAPIPSGPAGRHIPLLYSAWAMSANNPCPSICAKYLQYMGIENNTVFAQNNLSPFVTQETLQSYLTPDKPGNAYAMLVMKNHLREFSFQGHYWPYLMGYIDEMFKDIFLNKTSFKKAVKNAAVEMQSAMDQFMTWLEK